MLSAPLRRMLCALCRPPDNCALWLIIAAGLVSACGCSQSLAMASRSGGHAHTTIPYSGVRNDAARFEDYSIVDRSILQKKTKAGGDKAKR